MKQTTFIFAALIMLLAISCKKIQKQPSYTYVAVEYPIETWVSQYVQEHPNCFNNEITKEQASKDLLKAVEDSTTNFFDGIPVELRSINKTGKKTMAQFGSYLISNGLNFREPIGEVDFDIVVAVPDSVVSNLKEKELYALKVKKIGRLNIDAANILMGKETMFWNGLVLMDEEYDKVKVDLGIFYCDFVGIEKFNGRKQIKKLQK